MKPAMIKQTLVSFPLNIECGRSSFSFFLFHRDRGSQLPFEQFQSRFFCLIFAVIGVIAEKIRLLCKCELRLTRSNVFLIAVKQVPTGPFNVARRHFHDRSNKQSYERYNY